MYYFILFCFLSRERKKQKQKRSQGQDQKTVKQLLGDLYADKEYLEQLLKETG